MSVTYRFAAYEIDADRRELRRAGDLLEVQPKVLDVLVHLVEGRERVVTRQELLDGIWGDAAVSEGVLTTAIHAARSALGDSASKGWAIRTVSRRGYRFVAPVQCDEQRPTRPRVSEGGASRRPEIRPDALVGRSRSLVRVESAFASADSGRGRILTITGESGIGKTRLLDAVRDQAESWGARAPLAWCYAREGAPPYAPWAQILKQLVADMPPEQVLLDMGAGAADLVALAPCLREFRPDIPEPAPIESGPSRFRLFESLAAFLASASQRNPIVVLLDDIQAADQASLRLLGFLAREIRNLRVLVVVSLRENEAATDAVLEETLAELAHQFPGERMVLEGLVREDIEALVAQLTDSEPSAEQVDTILARSEGNPFFVREIVSLLDADGVGPAQMVSSSAWASSVPPGVRDVSLRRLHSRTRVSQSVLRAASVLGREFRLDVLARVFEGSPKELSDGLSEACATGFLRESPAEVDQYRFSHGLLQETVYDRVETSERKRLHRRAGEALESELHAPVDSSPAELAHHFIRAGDRDEISKAVEYAVRAGEEAVAVHAYEEAAAHFSTALDALERVAAPDDARRCDLLIALGAAEVGARITHSSGREALLSAARLAQEIGEPEQVARAALQASMTALQTGPNDRELMELLEAALDVVGDEPSPLRARLLANLAFQLLQPKTVDRGLGLSEEAVRVARICGEPAVVAEALNLRCAMRSGPDRSRDRIKDADDLIAAANQAGALELGLFGYRWRLLTWLELGDMEAADRELAAYDAAAERHRLWSGRWFGLTMRAARALAEARFDAAERMTVESYAHRREATTPLIISTFSTQLFWLRREQARLDEVALLQPHDGAEAHVPFRVLRILLDAELGHAEPARSQLHAFVKDELPDLPHDFVYLYACAVLTEICSSLEDEACVVDLYEALRPYADQYVVLFLGMVQFGSVSRFLGMLATRLQKWDEADAHFAYALEANRRIDAHLWIARTRLEWARMLEARGDAWSERARELLRPCIAEAHERGMADVLRNARALVDRLPL